MRHLLAAFVGAVVFIGLGGSAIGSKPDNNGINRKLGIVYNYFQPTYRVKTGSVQHFRLNVGTWLNKYPHQVSVELQLQGVAFQNKSFDVVGAASFLNSPHVVPGGVAWKLKNLPGGRNVDVYFDGKITMAPGTSKTALIILKTQGRTLKFPEEKLTTS